MEKLSGIGDELWICSSGDGTGEGHHKEFPVYSESIRFLQMHDCNSVQNCHPILNARMTESVRAHDKHSQGTFARLEMLNNSEQVVGENVVKCRICRTVDGSELAKGAGTSTFGCRKPCPCCGRSMAELRKLSSLGQISKDVRRDFDNPDCPDHSSPDCICNKHCMDKLMAASPPTARENNGYAPWDIDHPRHGKILDYCMDHLHGYTHPAMNTANWIGKWAGLLNYDPLHSDNNTFKPLWHIITDMHVILDIENQFAKRLAEKDIKMEMINVGQDQATITEIRAEYGDNVRVGHAEFLAKEKNALLNQRCTLTVGGVDYESFSFLEALAEFSNQAGSTQALAGRMFKVAHELTCLFNSASKILLNHTRLVDESVQFRELVDAYYKCMHGNVGAKLEMESWETYLKWPDHQKAEHMADDMHDFFELTGLPLGVTTCEVQEALNHFWKVEFGHTNGHTSSTNIDDNKFKQAMRNKYIIFLKQYEVKKQRKKRPFKHCDECALKGWNVDSEGVQIPHQNSQACARPDKPRAKKLKGQLLPGLPEKSAD